MNTCGKITIVGKLRNHYLSANPNMMIGPIPTLAKRQLVILPNHADKCHNCQRTITKRQSHPGGRTMEEQPGSGKLGQGSKNIREQDAALGIGDAFLPLRSRKSVGDLDGEYVRCQKGMQTCLELHSKLAGLVGRGQETSTSLSGSASPPIVKNVRAHYA